MNQQESRNWEVIVDALVEHLPDSSEKRMEILRSALLLLPKYHPRRAPLSTYLDSLVQASLLQREFPLGDEVVIQQATRGEPSTPIPPPPPNFRRGRGAAR
ncbi:MAG: hypothetical protein U1G08_02455 [Verrucomicrobiota bacterium]